MIKTNCIHFNLDRPCTFHKTKGVKCSSCGKFVPFGSKKGKTVSILIIKLDAMGDVLRTTFILKGLKEKYPKSVITWITAKESVDILKNNTYINSVLPFNESVYSRLAVEKFDISINLDLSPKSLALATFAYANKKTGYWLDDKRHIRYSNTFAKKWLLMSAFDDVKKKNTHTFQYWMSKIIGLKRADYEIVVPLNKESVNKADKFSKKHNLKNKFVIGINPGAGGRWTLKKWTTSGYKKLINILTKQGFKVLLCGGPGEEVLVRRLSKETKAINTGTNNSVPDFFALVNLSNLFITGDTLALHTALGLKKKVIAIFGPTSANEIEVYKRGKKIVSNIKCVCCYNPKCNVKPTCMDKISLNEVLIALERFIPKK